MKKWMLIIILITNLLMQSYQVVASDVDQVVDYEEIQRSLNELQIGKNAKTVDFKSIVSNIMEGKLDFTSTFGTSLLHLMFSEIFGNGALMAQIIVVSAIVAIFTNFTQAFGSKYTGEVGFFVTYLILFSIIIKSFHDVNQLATETVTHILHFMQALIPSFFATVTLASGAVSSVAYYQTMLLVITLIEWLMIKLILPTVGIILAMELVDNLAEEPFISKLSETLKKSISWILKSILLGILGLNVFQSFTAPIVDSFTGRSVKHIITTVPVVGNTLDGVADTILGSAMLIKNAVGVGGLVVLLGICLIPMLKILAFIILYRLTAAFIEPISDKRIVNCLNRAGDASALLLGCIFTASLLFIISIAVITAATNNAYFAR